MGEIDDIMLIMETVTRSWVENGTGLICSRCGRVFVPSETSDSIYCGMCYPCRGLALGDHGKQYAKCEYCTKDILGRRGDSKYCSDSCKSMACRKRNSISPTTTEDIEDAEAIRKQSEVAV